MALRQSIQIVQKLPTISADGYEPILIFGDFVVPANLVATDVVEMCVLPGGYVATAVKLITDDLDSSATPTSSVDVGYVTGVAGAIDNARTCGAEAIVGSLVGQTGGVAIDNQAAFTLAAPLQTDRGIGIRIGTASATLIVGARIRMTVTARPQLNGA